MIQKYEFWTTCPQIHKALVYEFEVTISQQKTPGNPTNYVPLLSHLLFTTMLGVSIKKCKKLLEPYDLKTIHIIELSYADVSGVQKQKNVHIITKT